MANKVEKTNVMRVLDKAEIPYQTHFYSPDTGIDAVSVAKALGQDPQAVFKTLVTQGKSRAFYVFVIPATGSLNLKRAAAACGEKAVEMIPQKAPSCLTPSVSARAKSAHRWSLRRTRSVA